MMSKQIVMRDSPEAQPPLSRIVRVMVKRRNK